MINANLLLKLPFDCETAMALVVTLLRNEGLSPQRTFNLRSACASLSDPSCPHHGDRPCDCQLIVLLVYDQQLPPVALIGHGYDDQTEICLEASGQRPHPLLTSRIRQALKVEL